MSPELIKELIADTKLPDIPDRYRAIVEIVGVENYIRLLSNSSNIRTVIS